MTHFCALYTEGMVKKRCTRCTKTKPIKMFWAHRGNPDGLQDYCKECGKEMNRKYAQTLSPERRRHYALRQKYDMTMDEYQELVARQSGRCAICNKERALVVDHCHAKGNVRGLLCHHCNTGIGLFDDDPAILELAIKYLQKK